jgi:hypothetical protein
MSRPLLTAHRLLIGLVAAMAVVALIGWTAYARSESSSATRDREHAQAMARMASERDGVAREVAVITTLRWSGSSGSALRGRPVRCAARERAT